MQRLQLQESEVVGCWIADGTKVRADESCGRIEWLISNALEKIAVSETSGAWETLFRDPTDGRYWERTYPQGNMHGGGPPALKNISREEAKKKYRF